MRHIRSSIDMPRQKARQRRNNNSGNNNSGNNNNNNNARGSSRRLVEKRANTPCAAPHEHLDKVGAGAAEEGEARGASDRARKQRLASAWMCAHTRWTGCVAEVCETRDGGRGRVHAGRRGRLAVRRRACHVDIARRGDRSAPGAGARRGPPSRPPSPAE